MRTKAAEEPSIFDFSAESAKIADWLAERSGFELSYMDPAPVASRSLD